MTASLYTHLDAEVLRQAIGQISWCVSCDPNFERFSAVFAPGFEHQKRPLFSGLHALLMVGLTGFEPATP
jgi:hypothetical protein